MMKVLSMDFSFSVLSRTTQENASGHGLVGSSSDGEGHFSVDRAYQTVAADSPGQDVSCCRTL